VCVCVCGGPSYPACNTQALYFIVCGINGTIFGRKLLNNTKCMFWFSLQLLSETFVILRRIKWDMLTNVHMCIGLHVKYRYCCQILVKLEFSRRFRKIPTCQNFEEISFSGSRVVPYGWTDGRTDT